MKVQSFLKTIWLVFLTSFFCGGAVFCFYLKDFAAKADNFSTTIEVITVLVCGNGVKEAGEQCDGADLAGQSCGSLGYDLGALSCKGNCAFDTSLCQLAEAPGPFPAGGWLPPPQETKLILQGKASPQAEVAFLQDGQLLLNAFADYQGDFKIELTDLTTGQYNFGLWAKDKAGRKSSALSLSVTILPNVLTTIDKIFLGPTISLSKESIFQGESLLVAGRTTPFSRLNLEIEPRQEDLMQTEADRYGDWQYSLKTAELKPGLYSLKAKALSVDNWQSAYSRELSFALAETAEPLPPPSALLCPGADLNQDGAVNLIDFSILMYWWGSDNTCADQNQDGLVNLVDFSIMMYWWTG